jgi:hypothetical protein
VIESTNRQAFSSWTRSLILGILWLCLASVIAVTQLASSPKIEVNWKTASEFDTAGFNIYRSEQPNQGFAQINDALIHSTADTTSGAAYSFIDGEVNRGTTYYYRLEDVEFDNTTTLHEVVTGRSENFDTWALLLVGICIVIGMLFLILAFRNRVNISD